MSNGIKKINLINYIINSCLSNCNFHDLIAYKLSAMRLQITVDSDGDNPKKKYRFDLPEAEVLDFFRLLSMNRQKIGCVFCSTDPYTQVLLMLTSSGLQMNDESIAKESYFLLLAKVWNNHFNMYFPTGIDVKIMDKVIEKKMMGKHLLKKYKTPYQVLANHFVPELINKYGTIVVADPVNKTKQLLNQAKRRIDQMFEANWVIDINTRRPRFFTGLVPLYRKMEIEMENKAA